MAHPEFAYLGVEKKWTIGLSSLSSTNFNEEMKLSCSPAFCTMPSVFAAYKHVNSSYDEGKVTFKIYQRKTDLCCPECGSREFVCKGTVTRSFRAVPIGLKPVFIVLALQGVFCRACNALKQVQTGFADRCRSYTRQFERYVLELSEKMTIQDVARHLKVS